VFELDDFEAAIAELDARYLAGEAAPYRDAWSVIARARASLVRHELPATTPDWVNLDHRRGIAFAPGDMTAYFRALWDDEQDFSTHIEAVHRLNNVGAVFTQVAQGTTHEGFDAEWRIVEFMTVDGDLVSRAEFFDETDIDTALARFDELCPPAPRLANLASQAYDRFNAYLATRDWDAMAAMIADDVCHDDRRRVVSGGIQRGRDAQTANLRAVVDVGVKNIESFVIAIRGQRLALTRTRASGGDQQPEAFGVELLNIVEIDTNNRIAAGVLFDPDDIDAAFAELDARYVAGDAGDYSHTWSVIIDGFAALARHELPSTAPDFVDIDHRRGAAFAPGELMRYLRAGWDVNQDVRPYVEFVHRLNNLGAVVTHAAHLTSREGFDAEWRSVDILTVDGNLINRCELFDEADLDAALAKFEQLSRPAPRLENTASRVDDRFRAHFAACDWEAMGEMLVDDMCNDDRRRVVNAGLRRGRDIEIANTRAFAELGVTNVTSDVIAIRGGHLALGRNRFMGRDQRPEAFRSELLCIVEIDADERIMARVAFDVDDIDAAFAELDARYLAGEAAAHSDTWSVIASGYAALNRREVPPTTPDWVNIDHRRGIAFAPGDMISYIRATWDVAPDVNIHIEAVHRLSNRGAVVTHAASGSSQAGFDAEWREIALLMVEGEAVSYCEMFDEADLDAALARFDELSRPAPLLENAATRARAHMTDAFNHRDLDGFLALMNPDGRYEDRRKGLRDEGLRRGKVVHALFEAPKSYRLETESVAIRGSRLGLTRDTYRDTSDPDRAITAEHLTLTEVDVDVDVDVDNLVSSTVLFDPDDINGAFGLLTDRWIASHEVAHPEVIEAVRRMSETVNRHDWDAFATLIAGATYVSHRQLGLEDADAVYLSSIRMFESLVPDLWTELAEVLTYSEMGIAAYMVLKGTSSDGVAIEIPTIHLALLDGERVTHLETFDPEQRDLALARFDELNRPA
jgi:predicted ester cyclase